MSEEKALTAREETKRKIIEKLKQVPKEESLVSVWVQDFKEQFLKDVQEEISESAKTLWFPDEDVKVNLEKITADFKDLDLWSDVLKKYKNGDIDERDLVDYIALSHLAVDPREIEPVKVLQRQVENGLKSRVGVKYIRNLLGVTQKALTNSVGALCEVLALEDPSKAQLLLGASQETIEGTLKETALVPVSETVKEALQTFEETIWDEQSVENLVSQMFAGDIIYDKQFDLTYEELLNKLADPDDYEFDSVRSIIVDAGMEQVNKAEHREQYTANPDDLRFTLYTVWLSNIFDGFGGTHSDDRSANKYRVKDPITEEQYLMLMNMVKQRYIMYVEGRTEWGQMRMGWRTQLELNQKIKHPFYHLTPYDKDVIINTALSIAQSPDGSIDMLRDFFNQILQAAEEPVTE